MNFEYNSNRIYNKWVNESKKVFSKWKDSDFYSNKAEHVYFYGPVSDESVTHLQHILQESSKTKITNGVKSPPKPIVIHLNSPGGSVSSMNLFNVMMTTQRVPLCIVIETRCFSAATTLALLAPYRVMIDYSQYMIHDMFGVSIGKEHEQLSKKYAYIYQNLSNYLSLLKDRTILSDTDIKKFISRDMFVNSSFCLKKKIIDRVLTFPKINNSSKYNKSVYSDLSLKLPTFLKKTNLNHLNINPENLDYNSFVYKLENPPHIANSLPQLCVLLDSILLQKSKVIKPILLHFKPSYGNMSPLQLVSLQYRIALVQKKTPVIALIEGPIYLGMLSLVMMCPIRIMMTPSLISSQFSSSFSYSKGHGFKTIDMLYNTKYILAEITKFFKKFSNLPDKFYVDYKNKIINLKPKDSLHYKLINRVVNFRKITPIKLKNIHDYYNIDSLISDYKNKNNNKKKIKSKKKIIKSKKKKITRKKKK